MAVRGNFYNNRRMAAPGRSVASESPVMTRGGGAASQQVMALAQIYFFSITSPKLG